MIFVLTLCLRVFTLCLLVFGSCLVAFTTGVKVDRPVNVRGFVFFVFKPK